MKALRIAKLFATLSVMSCLPAAASETAPEVTRFKSTEHGVELQVRNPLRTPAWVWIECVSAIQTEPVQVPHGRHRVVLNSNDGQPIETPCRVMRFSTERSPE